MRGVASTGADILSTRVKPVLIEGYWYIVEIEGDRMVLMGQFDPRGWPLDKIAIERSWIDQERG